MVTWPDQSMGELNEQCLARGTKVLGQLIFWTAYQAKAQKMLEIGIGNGYVTMLLGRAALLTEGTHVSVDIDEPTCVKARRDLERFGLKRSGVLCRDSLSLPDEDWKALDFLFIDGDHSERQVLAEWKKFEPLLKQDCTVWLHDTVKQPGPVALLALLESQPTKWRCVTWPQGPGYTMLVRNKR